MLSRQEDVALDRREAGPLAVGFDLEGLEWLRGLESGRAWLARLPERLDVCRERWELRLGQPYPDCQVSLAVPAELPGGRRAVLKLQFPHRECRHEADALACWNGNGAVRLLGRADEHGALLLERCEPGDHLATRPADEALSIASALLPRLWIPVAAPFTPLAEEAARWAESLPLACARSDRVIEARLVDAAVETLTWLAASQSESVLLHQDLHGHNILSAQREPWLAIDPKPLAGERAFGIAPLVRSYELGHDRAQVLRRLDRLSEELELDRERARGWAFAQTLAWSIDARGVLPRHVETARWLLADAEGGTRGRVQT